MTTKRPWLTPNKMSEADKARQRQIAKEQSLDSILKKLDQIQRTSTPALRTEPRVIAEQSEPKVIAERAAPRAISDPAPPPSAPEADQQLVELVQLYQRLSPRQQLELLYIARIKMHLNQKAAE